MIGEEKTARRKGARQNGGGACVFTSRWAVGLVDLLASGRMEGFGGGVTT